jgi:hypothetical protein
MLRLVRHDRFEPARRRPVRRVSAPRRLAPIEVPPPRFRVTEEEPNGLRLARRALKMGLVVGSLTAAWQIGMVIGQL